MLRTHYIGEVESFRQNLILMGENTIAPLAEAIGAVVSPNCGASERASELEAQTDHLHRRIQDQCQISGQNWGRESSRASRQQLKTGDREIVSGRLPCGLGKPRFAPNAERCTRNSLNSCRRQENVQFAWDLMLICRHLECILRHADQAADAVIMGHPD